MSGRVAVVVLTLALVAPAAAAGEDWIFSELSLDPPRLDGLHLSGEDWSAHLGGYAALGYVFQDGSNVRGSSFVADALRPRLDGSIGPFSLFVESDLLGTDTRSHLYGAWLGWEPAEWFRIRAGQVRVALGSEFGTREENLPFPGYAFPAHLDGRYDWGAAIDGELFDGGAWYAAFATIGHGFNPEGHDLDSPLFGLRGVVFPLSPGIAGDGIPEWLRGFFGGLSYAVLTDFDDGIHVTNPHESVVFTTSPLDGDSGNWLHWEFGYRFGPVRVGLERVVGSANDVPVGGGSRKDLDQISAWALYAAWNITGEEQVWSRGGWGPSTPDGERRDGRWELSVRYSNADIDRDLFNYGFTTYDPSTQEVRTFSAELGFEPIENLRLSAAWVRTIADHDLGAFGGGDRDSTVSIRLEFVF